MSGLSIGNLRIDPPIVLAPMAGVTNRAFRTICKELGGCGLICAEMVSAYALHYTHQRTHSMLDWDDSERPVSCQVFGADPHIVADAAKIVEDAGADIIDINMGCPVPKVTKTGAGASMMQDLELAEKIIAAVVGAVSVPVTVKTRKGWDDSKETAIDIAKIAERNGVAAVGIHGRTAEQGYSGNADWDIIRRVKDAVSIPVIGNGDVRCAEDAQRMFDETGCDAVMIGRAALGNPWIFSQVSHYVETGELMAQPSFRARVEAARLHAQLLTASIGDLRASREMRGHISWYLKGIPGVSVVRARIMECVSLAQIEEVLDEASSKC